MFDDSTARSAFFTRAISRQWQVLAAAIVVGLLVAAAYVTTNAAKYSSTSIVFLEPLAGNPYSPATPPSRAEQLAALTTEAGLVYTDAVVDLASEIGTTQGRDLGANIRNNVVTEVPSNSQVVQITYTESTPELAQAGSQALAEAYLQYRKVRATRVVEARSELSTQQLESISALLDGATEALNAASELPESDQAEALDLEQQVILYANQLAQVRLDQTDAAATSILPGDIISPAPLPSSRDGAHPLLVATGILLMTIFAGILLALIREHADKRIHNSQDLVASGVTPILGGSNLELNRSDDSATREKYRRVYNSLRHLTTTPHNVLMISGASNQTPTWEVAAGIAEALEEAGLPVTLVLASEGAPNITDPESAGLTDLLSGRHRSASAHELLVEVSGLISLLGVGTQPNRLGSLVQSHSLETVFVDLNSSGLVIIAGPSVNSATGGALARVSSAVLLVIEENETEMFEVVTAREALEQTRTEVVGGVLLRSSKRSSKRSRKPVEGSIFNLRGQDPTPRHASVSTEAGLQHPTHT
ncbi:MULTISPECIES: hypothetical protein [unclassified Arthrobacter]|uniref:hypothetical protein n=1 Tax=unclassified Arthrobacter TaxID=235627 RepID=UPI0014909A3E|nr:MULTISPECIES: hypothetical protein [unclassified Arthrobacter]MBE0009079.1 hypothetical protein [Arthrobacter sp. AET 35A]NOJ62791.1 hypothetical protein [Arthrobacter sp. 147(2020)]